MAGKHTAGPWRIKEFAGDGWVVIGPDDRFVETIYRDEDCPEETEANARLIAAAPDLLEALNALVSNRYSCFIPEDGSVAELYEWTERARELIARATQPLPPPNEESK